jgi:hypothetical protein
MIGQGFVAAVIMKFDGNATLARQLCGTLKV